MLQSLAPLALLVGASLAPTFAVSVEDDRQTKNKTVLECHVLDDAVVPLLVHETREGGEPAVNDQLDVAQLAGGELEREIDVSSQGRFRGVVGEHHVNEGATMGHCAELVGGGSGGRPVVWVGGVSKTRRHDVQRHDDAILCSRQNGPKRRQSASYGAVLCRAGRVERKGCGVQ